ncbi:autophagy-related protein 16-1-like [Homarus americanus]|uniref:autophagy-related protein 16-1-like n=1 Tax=Homarus americanus TaxID=6706 RepID=UPI001C442F9A|nr:autophagy-related protein 16-1-like [Homarus americanus]
MAWNKASEGDWRQSIYCKLRERNKKEYENINDLIQLHNRLFEQSESLRTENLHLTLQNERLRQENTQLQSQGGGGGGEGGGSSSVVVQALEQKVYKLQEELTNLHRRKGENAQQLVELNQCLQERDKLMASKDNKLAEYESDLLILREDLAAKEAVLADVQAVNQVLRDEYQTLNLAFTALEDKYRKAQGENRELIDRWMAQKAKDAEKLNMENDTALKKRQLVLEEQLKEAAREPKQVNTDDKFACSPPICLTAILPAKAYLKFDAHDGEVNSVCFSPQGRILATGGADRKLKLWDISRATVEAKGLLTGSNAGVTAIDFDAEESLILGASNDFASRVWTVVDHRLRHTLTGHSGKVMAARFLSESAKVVTGSHDRTLKIWDLRSRACIRTIFAGSSCNDLVPSDSAATTIISGHFDKKIRFWDTRTEQSANEVPLQGKITSLSLSRDGFYLLSCVRDDSLKILDLRKNKVVHTFTGDGFHVGTDYTRATFSPDAMYVAAGTGDGAVYIWNVNTGKLEKTFREHSACVVACTWHPSGKSLVSCDRAKKVIAWSDF